MSLALTLDPVRGSAPPWRRALQVSATRTVALGGAALALSVVQSLGPGRRLFLCPLRAVTGIPCPLCGGTTAAIDLARLDIPAALGANPLAVVGALLFVLAPVLLLTRALPFTRGMRLSRALRDVPGVQLLALTGVLVFSEVWQLARFGLLR